MDNFEKAVEASKNLTNNDGIGHHVINHLSEFLDGQLYVVGFKSSEGQQFLNYVYIEGEKATVYKNEALLLSFVSKYSKKSGLQYFFENIGGIAGLIGLIITFTIVYLIISNPKNEIPQILSAALTTILGFYFGTKTNK
jgi:hypothetical protein